MEFNTTFNNISGISCGGQFFIGGGTRVTRKTHRPVASH
jgi:hypothetical protein